jgi:hypothetical protein
MSTYILASRYRDEGYSVNAIDYSYEGRYDSYNEADKARLWKSKDYPNYWFEIFSEDEWENR